MEAKIHKPVLIVIAGPNGSGKTTITSRVLHHEWLEDPKVLEKEYQIVVIGTHHKMFDSIDMNNLITDKGFICDIYGIHKPRN